MIRRIDLRGASQPVDHRSAVPRAGFDVEAATHQVRPIIDDVRTRGLDAVLELTERFDGVRLADIRVPVQTTRAALEALDPAVRAALEESISRLRTTCEADLHDDTVIEVAPGAVITHPVGAGRPGRALRARGSGAAGLDRGDERRAGAGGRCRLTRPGHSAHP